MNSIAPEVLHDGDDVYLASHDSYRHQTGERRYYVLGFDRLRVGPRGLEIVPENGLGADWPEIEGDAFGGEPIIGDNPVARGDPSSGMVGRGYLSSRERFTWPPERSGDQRGRELTGRLRSRPFTIRGTSMTLLVGGTAGDSTYVALVRLADGEVLHRETGRDTGTMDLRRWDLTPYYGTEARIEIADRDLRGWIDVDEILEHDLRTGSLIPGGAGAPRRRSEPVRRRGRDPHRPAGSSRPLAGAWVSGGPSERRAGTARAHLRAGAAVLAARVSASLGRSQRERPTGGERRVFRPPPRAGPRERVAPRAHALT